MQHKKYIIKSLFIQTYNLILYIINIPLYIINIPLALIIIFISPFYKIRIGELEMRAIGHCSISMEIFLSEMECGLHNDGSKHVWFVNSGFSLLNKQISNTFLLKKWKEKVTIGPRFIFEPLFYIFRYLRKFSIGNKFLIPYRHWLDHTKENPWQIVDKFNVLEKTHPQIRFTDDEEKIGQAYLKKYGLEKNKYICFFARTSEYRNDTKVSIRDSDIHTQIYGLEKICKEYNLKAVRLGYSPKSKLNLNNQNIIDYSNSNERTDFLDFYLGFHCKFIVGTSSGGCFIPMMNRKKLLAVDLGNFGELMHWTSNYIPIIILKKFFCKGSGKYLKYGDVIQLGMHKENFWHQDHNAHLYGWEDNSRYEIYNAIKEMNMYIEKKTNLYYSNHLSEKRFINFTKKLNIPFNHFINTSFIEENHKLFD